MEFNSGLNIFLQDFFPPLPLGLLPVHLLNPMFDIDLELINGPLNPVFEPQNLLNLALNRLFQAYEIF